MVLERSVDKQTLANVQLDYSIRMNDPGRETRGLMVIRQTTKTRAKQRKQAITNWKVSLRNKLSGYSKRNFRKFRNKLSEYLKINSGNS